MTTTELSAYLDAHGVPGAPTEPGHYIVAFHARAVRVVEVETHGGRVWWGTNPSDAISVIRHAPLILAAPPGRDLDAEVVAGVRAQRKEGE